MNVFNFSLGLVDGWKPKLIVLGDCLAQSPKKILKFECINCGTHMILDDLKIFGYFK